jgi:hypothetical protein
MSEQPKRSVSAADLAALKSATRSLVDALGGAHDAAKCTRVSAAMISNYCLAHDPSFMPIDVLADLEAQVGERFVGRVIDMIAARTAKEHAESFFKHLGDVGEASGHLTKVTADALSDGHTDAHDLRNMERAGFSVVLQGLEFVRDCRRGKTTVA